MSPPSPCGRKSDSEFRLISLEGFATSGLETLQIVTAFFESALTGCVVKLFRLGGVLCRALAVFVKTAEVIAAARISGIAGFTSELKCLDIVFRHACAGRVRSAD